MKLRFGFFTVLLTTLPLLHCGGSGGTGGTGGEGGSGEPTCPGGAASPPSPSAHVCEAGEVIPPSEGTLVTRDKLTGDNGTFVDHCKTCDTLVTYTCEVISDDPCEDICESVVTGTVLEKTIACPCADGKCITGCPELLDKMKVDAIAPSGTTTLIRTSTGEKYECATVENADDSFPCDVVPVGTEGGISLLVDEGICSAGTGAFNVLFDDHCRYSNCALVP